MCSNIYARTAFRVEPVFIRSSRTSSDSSDEFLFSREDIDTKKLHHPQSQRSFVLSAPLCYSSAKVKISIQFNDFVQKDSGIIIHTNNETSAEVHAVLTVPSEHSSRELFVALTNNVSSTTNFEANSTQNVQRFNDSYVVNSSFFWRIEYSVIAAVSGAIALILLVGIFLCWRRHSRVVHPPQRSVYSVQDGTWDSLSLHYMDNPAEFAKNEAWDEMSDDSYVASLDQAMSRKMAPVTYYRNNAVLMNGPSAFRYSTSSTVPIVSTSPTQDPQQF